jgi:osmotically inducible lipoprotein OsmB
MNSGEASGHIHSDGHFKEQRHDMKTIQRLAISGLLATTLVGLGGCSGMTAREKDTAIGAGAGAVVGGVLSGGSAIGTVGGAAVGGIIGNQVGKDKK